MAVLVFFVLWLGIRLALPLAFPFLLGLGLALAAEPLTGLLCRKAGLPRCLGAGIGVSGAFLLITLVLLLAAGLALRGLGLLAAVLPELEEAMFSGISLLESRLLGLADRLPEGMGLVLRQSITDFFSGGTRLLEQGGKYILGLAGGLIRALPDSFLTLATAVISGFMLSARMPRIKERFRLCCEKFHALAETLKRVRKAVGGWLLAQVKLSTVSFGILVLGLVILRIPYAPLWALGVAVLDSLPLLGTGTVLLPWAAVAFLRENAAQAVGLLGIYTVVSLTRSALEPRLLGQQLGLDPLAALAALYTGFRLWGLGGMILAPVLAVTVRQILEKP